MKLVLLILLFISTVQAVTVLPAVTVNEGTIGGDIILINMKDYLVIQGDQSKVLQEELGAEVKNNFTRDLVLTKSVEYLQANYGNDSRPITNEIISRYGEIISIHNKRQKLN